MDPLLCFPATLPPELVSDLEHAGYTCRFASTIEELRHLDQSWPGNWLGAVVAATDDPDQSFMACHFLRRRDVPVSPLLLVLPANRLRDVQPREALCDDFCLLPAAPGEARTRLDHLLWRTGRETRSKVIEHGPLQLNLETYQAAVAGRVLDLTYMEYELLRFLASNPAKVFTREALLSKVWGYEYYGGARTVDVHVRRLRAKLGEEHAHLIQTVRSVGYRFGQGGWITGSNT